MRLTFHIDYYPGNGETLYMTFDNEASGEIRESLLPMTLQGKENWHLTREIPADTREVTYSYVVRKSDGSERREWGKPHRVNIGGEQVEMEVFDLWNDVPADRPYHSSAFTECFCHRGDRSHEVVSTSGVMTLKFNQPVVMSDEVLALVGSSVYLEGWNPQKAIRLSDASYPIWSVNLQLSQLSAGDEFKIVKLRRTTGVLVGWEEGANRRLERLPSDTSKSVVMTVVPPRFETAPWRGTGVAIPVFSLRSEDDFGVGDFYDLKLMIDWAASTGQDIVQILPIHDTTMTGRWTDSYPYNANSAFALHPMYLRVQAMGRLRDEERQLHFDRIRRELCRLPDLDYEKVNKAKNEFTRALFEQDGPEVLSSEMYREFFERNKGWLVDYASWCIVRDLCGTPDMRRWGDYSCYATAPIGQLIEDHRKEFDYVCYLQYHLDAQLREVRDYAHRRGIAIKGDIPIGISRTSVDAWVAPHLFNLDSQAGAPPDTFAVLGQNWGFPTYNWAEMSKDGFAWWKARFRKMAEYFDAYRIDHVLGFFRIWQIPYESVHGLLGIFNRALPYSPEELEREFDFTLRLPKHTTPYITDEMLEEMAGSEAGECRACYLERNPDGSYRFKPEFDTQRKIAEYFGALHRTEHDNHICATLMLLADEVLFIEDPYEKGKYHPRISAWSSHAYKALSDYERRCFDKLYSEFYYHRNDKFWYEKAMWKLPTLIEATEMLVCAEDLGMIPGCVPEVMEKLQILVLEIQRMSKDPEQIFGQTDRYPYLSVCTTSSHDMDGIRRWWETDRELTQRYYNEVLGQEGDAPFYAEPWICERIINLHLESPSMLCILPLQDWLSIDGVVRRHDPREELINIPSNPRHYWRYRMHITLEQLNGLKELNNRIRENIVRSGRK